MKRLSLLLCAAIAVGLGACTERLTTTGDCPAFCPGGQAVFRDTILTAVPNGDSSFTGYLESSSLISVLASSGGSYGQNRAVIRFLRRSDSVSIADTARAFTVDSIALEFGLQAVDTTVPGFVLEIYRLPLSVDSTTSLAAIDALMTPARLVKEVAEPVSFRSGMVNIVLSSADLAKLAFVPADSNVLQLGFRVRASGPTAARIGTPASGAFAPLFSTYVHAIGVADTLQPQVVSVISDRYFTASSGIAAPSSTLLAVGGIPVSRSFIRFNLPPYLHDTVTIIRATLHLETDAPVTGIPADTALLVATSVLTDFGAKSPVVPSLFATTPLLPGATSADLEVGNLVQLWQGKTGLPSIFRLALGQEGGTFSFPLFRSTRSVSGRATLRITYRPPFGFEGY